MAWPEDRVYEERLRNASRFSEALADHIHALEAQLSELRKEARKQRQRAELWRQRALSRSKR